MSLNTRAIGTSSMYPLSALDPVGTEARSPEEFPSADTATGGVKLEGTD
jgi:hypothetical protein